MGQSDPEKEQQIATANDMKLLIGFCSTACRMASIAAPLTFRVDIKSLGWVGLEPTTNALKGRYYYLVSG